MPSHQGRNKVASKTTCHAKTRIPSRRKGKMILTRLRSTVPRSSGDTIRPITPMSTTNTQASLCRRRDLLRLHQCNSRSSRISSRWPRQWLNPSHSLSL